MTETKRAHDAGPDSTSDGTASHGAELSLSFGLHRLGLATLAAPWLALTVFTALAIIAALGIGRLRVDDSLSELFRTATPEFQRFEEVDRRFPSTENDVLVVIEGANLLKKPQLEAVRRAMVELQLADGVNGVVSMLSARGKPDATGYVPPILPDELPDGDAYDAMIRQLRSNEIVQGKFLSDDGTLAMAVLALDREAIATEGTGKIITGIGVTLSKELSPAGLRVQLTGAPVMQLEIRNAVERDQLTYNGLGLLFGAGIAWLFFRSARLMLLAALPPVLAVLLSLGLLGWAGFKLNLFLNVMTPLVMVMGFADSMQMTYAIRDRMRAGDSRAQAIRFAVNVVGPACVIAHATALVSFVALMFSDSGLIQTFGKAGALATCVSYLAVIGAMPMLGIALVRETDGSSIALTSSDTAMQALARFVGAVVDWVVARAALISVIGLALGLLFAAMHLSLVPRYRLADQVPDREQALKATSRLDQKLTGANPVHVMIQWKGERGLYDPETLGVIADAHATIERAAGLGNVWSLDSLRRWLIESGDDRVETVKKYVGLLPRHLVERFIAKDEKSVLVTGRLPDKDSSEILPTVEKLDAALNTLRKAHPAYDISVTGLPAIAARNSARLIGQLDNALWVAMALVAVLLGLAFRSVFVSLISLLPSLFPIVAAGAVLRVMGEGLEFSSVIALVVIFGLGVDALIHFLNRLHREERPGEAPEHAIRRARVLVGPAIILTTIVLAFGLGVTMFSSLPSLRLFGRVCAITLMASLIGDLIFLPATVALARRFWPVKAKG
jgi:uncharacterized protein